MNPALLTEHQRILIIDDNPAIHGDFRKILGKEEDSSKLSSLEETLFGNQTAPVERAVFRIDSAFQGQEALAKVQAALEAGDPYAMAFVDVRMPPGWDGIETLERLWQCSPDLQAVICTAYSDYSWDEMTRRLAQTDNLLILKKPFDTVEVLQLAHALTTKYVLSRQARLRMEDLDRMVHERTQKLQEEIQQRTRVQEALRISEERFSKAFEASPMPMAIQTRAEQRFLDANPSFFKLTAYEPGQLLHHTDSELSLWQPVHTAQGQPVAGEADRVRKQPSVLRRADGKTRQTLLWTEPISLNDVPCRLLIVEDVTDHLKLEGQLRQAQKMEAVGCLAAGIAHEFNNLLTVIQGHSGLLRDKRIDPNFAVQSVDRIQQASERAASLTRRLLAFSRKQALQLKVLDLSTAVQCLRQTLARLVNERCQLVIECAPDLPPIRADESHIEQVLINLVMNGRDAMTDGGTIKVGTSLAVVDQAAAQEHVEARPGNFLCLSVSDTGCGIAPEMISRIFDPFFTTKEIGKGTGLGLATVQGIVQQHQGWIQVESRPGLGSTFRVFLPVWETALLRPAKHDAPAAAAPGADTPSRASGETVLLVEDEPAVRELARVALESGGYRVFEAADGPQALSVWDKSSAPIQLLLTDLVMPNGLSGGALARELQCRNPSLRTVFTTGQSSEVLKDEWALTQGDNFLPKPFDPPALLETVKKCLATR